jgi:hypothetical protein
MSTTALSPRQAPSAADVVRLLQTAYRNAWEKYLRKLGVTAPANLPPAELTRFADRVFWLVRQTGFKDPAVWLLAHRARVEATKNQVAAVEPETPVEIAGTTKETQNRGDDHGQACGSSQRQ